jgi:hypothetical protein
MATHTSVGAASSNDNEHCRPTSVYDGAMWKAGILFVVTLACSGCVTATTVAAPDGSEGQLIRCTDTADCYDKAREACNGPYHIADSGNRAVVGGANGAVWSEGWHEILVECGTGSPAAPSASTQAPRNTEPKPADNAPNQGGGFSLGASVEATKAACEAANLEWKGSGHGYQCGGTPVDTGMHAHTRLTFCDDELCRIDIVVPPADGSAVADNVTRTVTTLSKRYGDATEHDVAYGPSCLGEALPDCLDRGDAHFYYQWRWAGGKKLTLSLGPRKPPSTDAPGSASVQSTMHIRYDDGRFLKRKAAQSKSSSGTAQTEEVEGL